MTFATLEDAWGVPTFRAAPSYGGGGGSVVPIRRHPAHQVEAHSPRTRPADPELKQALRRSILQVRDRDGVRGVASLLGRDLVDELCSASGGGGGWWDIQGVLEDPETLLRLLVGALAVLVIADLLK
jgi:hypothetical protein